MSKLTPVQQAFVDDLLDSGGQSATASAARAGYADDSYGSLRVQACRLMRSENILAALREESIKRMMGASVVAVSELVRICSSGIQEKDRLKAIEMVLNRTGMQAISEHKVSVSHDDRPRDELVKEFLGLVQEAGIDRRELAMTLRPHVQIEAKAEPSFEDWVGE
jgi:phage terminase small subunit